MPLQLIPRYVGELSLSAKIEKNKNRGPLFLREF